LYRGTVVRRTAAVPWRATCPSAGPPLTAVAVRAAGEKPNGGGAFSGAQQTHGAADVRGHALRSCRRGESLVRRASAAGNPRNNAPERSLNPVQTFLKPMKGLWGQLIPMASMFFWMALANGLLDALKDTLVVTAFGGAEQIPYLTVYAVLPMSFVFVGVFAKFSQRWGREKIFYVFLGTFMAFFAVFTWFLYPNAAVLHPTAFAEQLVLTLPKGLAGGVAVLTNWVYSLFYVSSELWGDVILSLLFWGMANETTRLRDASVIYPLLGVGANVAQATSGAITKWVSGTWQPDVPHDQVWGVKLRFLMTIVMCCGVAIAATHAYIMRRKHLADGGAGKEAARVASQKAEDDEASLRAINAERALAGKKPKQSKTGLFDALRFVMKKPEVTCLAIMSVAQGLSSILFQVAWKGQLRILHPSPQAYSAFMGDVQLMSGALTCTLMLAAPWLFKKLGWAGTLSVTPKAAMGLGWAFFGFSIWMAKGGFLIQTSSWLPVLVWGGSILYVIERAAKFSLFKPAEEMVYITLDEESRTKGKAAVDVLGAQVGKTGGSFMQQGLLICCGTIVAALPALMAAHSFIVVLWLWAVKRLDNMHGAELERMHEIPEDEPDALSVAAA
jgi:AAA family ATP:ADP antiporter